VQWVASPPSFLRVDANGVATGGPFSGGAAVTAEVKQPNGTLLSRSLGVTVVPQGTFVLSGVVTDAEIPTLPVRGARVDVLPGSLSVLTDTGGFFRIYGVPPNPQIRIAAAGYETLTESLQVSGDVRQDFRLPLSGPRLNLTGAYTLTVEVTAGCGDNPPLPQHLRRRQYDAFITQTGLGLQVALTEPRFLVVNGAGNRFGGQVQSGASATFALDWTDEGYPNVVERLGDGTFLVIWGTVSTTGSAGGLSGPFGGSMAQYAAGFPGTLTLLGICSSPRFTLAPR